MTAHTVQQLLLFSTACNGVLAGINADRYIVQVPAWRRLSRGWWAEYSRHADLGNGLVLYSVLPLTAAVLSIVVASGVASANTAARLPATLAAACSMAGIGLTFFAAPHMLRLRRERGDEVEAASFRRFHAWGLARAIPQIAAFPFSLWALNALAH
jgi:hypothetical protein